MDYWRRNGTEDESVWMEVSGDSEADSDPEKILAMTGGGVLMCYGVDDAESCSSESYYHVLLDYDEDDDHEFVDGCDETCDDDHRQETGEDHDQQQPPEGKYCNADESSEVMDAMEDRIFWETCLAVGFSSKP